ncbi:hypothetical protein I79_024952 [Cricetulus griseus]|uniref:Uncharacterized protein n=1 Tax=Cricetulus griseus TaxID=10029 RepID=G3IM22_CRIGR|nr:hypothetical protein I79_024952 [Cricetulus griseus]
MNLGRVHSLIQYSVQSGVPWTDQSSAAGFDMPRPNGSIASICWPRIRVWWRYMTRQGPVSVLYPSAVPGYEFCIGLRNANVQWQFCLHMLAQDPSSAAVYDTPMRSGSSVSICRAMEMGLYKSTSFALGQPDN